jgi:hypothetical protein
LDAVLSDLVDEAAHLGARLQAIDSVMQREFTCAEQNCTGLGTEDESGDRVDAAVLRVQ